MVPPFVMARRCAPARAVMRPRVAVPRDARAQVGEVVGRVAAAQHVEHAVEARARAGPRTAPRRARDRRGRARSSRPRRPRRRSAARGRRAGCAGRTSPRPRRGACSPWPPRRRRGPAGASARGRPAGRRPRRGSRGRCAAGPTRRSVGASIWTTRSTAPMSIPSSSDEVATMARRSPRLRRSSMAVRFSRASEPWCARATSLGCVAAPLDALRAPDRSAPRRAVRPGGGC